MTNEVEKSEAKPVEENGTAASDKEVIKTVAERLRFFFSDANVRTDHFMRQKLLKSDEKKGYVPIEVLLRFNSIRTHTTDPKVIVQAAKMCSDRLVLAEDETSIARVSPFTMSMMDDNIPLSLYVGNLPIAEPEEGKNTQYAVSMDEVRALFEPYGDVTLVKLQFQKVGGDNDATPAKKKFDPTGGAFVEFETAEQQQKALEDLCAKKDGEAVEPKTKLTLSGNTLDVITLREWIDSKKKKLNKQSNDAGAKPGPKKREREEVPEPEIVVKEFTVDWKPGCVIQVKGLGESCDREAIRAAVAKGLEMTEEETVEKGIYADYSRGQTGGAIRFNEPSDSISALVTKLASGDVEIAGAKVESASILEGEEEQKYWANFIEFKNKQARHKAEEKASKKKTRRGRY